MNYILQRIEHDETRRLSAAYGCDLLSATILARRGVYEREDVKYYLESSSIYLNSPFLFKDMETAVERILGAVEDGEHVLVFGDRDADGVTSTALMVSELKSMGLDVSWRLPEGDSPYGMTMEDAETIAGMGVTLVITVDCGISCNEEIAFLNSQGIDTIVTDHHIPGDFLPAADAYIDPKTGDYPFEHLAGCGVAAKVIWALRFAKTPYYGSRVILLHAEPGPGESGTTTIQAVQLENLVETDRIIEEVPNGAIDLNRSRAAEFLARNIPVIVIDRDVEMLALRRAFGGRGEIPFEDFRPTLEKVVPRSRGKSLFELSKESRAVRYADGHPELETLISLFRSACIYSEPKLSREWDALLDYVAIGTVADLMPLKGENRILVKLGLKRLSRNPRESLIPLLSAQNLIDHPVSATDISWYISPVINSAGRLGKPSVALELLLAENPEEAARKTDELLALNKERKKMSEDVWEIARPRAKKSAEAFGSKFLLVEGDDIPRGLTGALASRLLKEFPEVPAAIVLGKTESERISASIRSCGNFNSRDFLALFSEHFSDFGGHKYAGGFSMKKENLPAFKARLEEEVLKLDAGEAEEEPLVVDARIPSGRMNADLIKLVELFEPYGEQSPALVFLLDEVVITEIREIGTERDKGNLKITVRCGSTLWSCVYWGGAKHRDFEEGDECSLIFRLSRNYWKGIGSLQLTVLALEKHQR